jgi:hypothetical protein
VLAARFRDEHTHIPDEPFVGATMRRVAAERERSVTTRHVLQAAALLAAIAASPWLIEGSVLLSALIDQGFTRASAWLATPAGMAIAAVTGAVLAWRYRRRRVR